RSLFAGKLDNLDFPRRARAEFGIDTVEYVDQFFKDKVRDAAYLAELRKRCNDEGVRSGLIMVDTAGDLGDADAAARSRAVDLHRDWMDAAKSLGCHSLRVNARGRGDAKELGGRIAESCGTLAEHGSKIDLNVVIENHGGPSSDADWLAGVLRQVASPFIGSLPDFGNFPRDADRYAAVEKLMPFARGVSAKSGAFDAAGNDVETDYSRMMKIVFDAGFRGHVGVESSGAKSPEEEPRHIQLTKALLERVRAAQPSLKPIFNKKDLDGWTRIAGGDWSVQGGILTARNGKDWSTDPSRTGSWLRTNKEYSDFDLFLEYSLKPRSNSGIFFRSGLERNPAFTGYEVQVHDSPGTPPRKTGAGSLYDYAAPSKNRVRPAGEWNQVRVIAKGPSIRVHINGELVIDTRGDRAARGYIGLQNHDERSEASFRNILLAEL
ncbi:MAG TPA: family 16 glycoside hydrolase, partial [Planctomycetota bacterium]|nr:family 16 glycoside hydrolase [Planctomycetota bacterium]